MRATWLISSCTPGAEIHNSGNETCVLNFVGYRVSDVIVWYAGRIFRLCSCVSYPAVPAGAEITSQVDAVSHQTSSGKKYGGVEVT